MVSVDKTLTMLNVHNRSSIIVGKDLTDIVLLGHSFGGTLLRKLPKRLAIAFDGSSSSMLLSSMMVKASEIAFHRIFKRYLTL